MAEMTPFDRDYFLQTRREIDTEKQERDHILNFAVVVLGAIAFAIAQNTKAAEFLKSAEALMLEASGLVVITTLFWVRWKKLRQIADRWVVLKRMLDTHLDPAEATERLETIVVLGLESRRYLAKDIALNFALSLPIYGLLGGHAWTSAAVGSTMECVACGAVVIVHAAVSLLLLRRPYCDPFTAIRRRIEMPA